MQRWGQYLAEVPQTLLRLIASHQRVSMPRHCSPELRLNRLRQAICRSVAAREAFFGLHAEERAVVQALLAAPPGAARAHIITDLGAIRPLAALRGDRTPQSLAERLLLMGWLLPRPAGPHHPASYLLAPELREWLPRPLALPATEPPPPSSDLPLALRAATALILAAARAPLPLRQDGRPTAVTLRRLRPLLSPATPDEADALGTWLVPLLADLDLLAAHGSAAAPGRAAARFLAQSHADRQEALRAAWVRSPRPEAWLCQMHVCTRGITWPALRRRLLAWAAALPTDQVVAVETSYESLCRTLGPLADSYTHRLRPAGRSPWQPRRAAAVWQMAVAGPLAWLGVLRHVNRADSRYPIADSQASAAHMNIVATPYPIAERGTDDTAHPWRYGDPGTLYVPHAAGDVDLLDLQPFAFPIAADTDTTTYRLSRASVAAGSRSHSSSLVRGLLERRAGPVPEGWADLLTPTDGLYLRQRSVLLSESPELMANLARQPAIRRRIEAVIAPGVALVRPGGEAALERALERAGVAVEEEGAGGRGQEAGGRRPEAGGREREAGGRAGGRRREAGGRGPEAGEAGGGRQDVGDVGSSNNSAPPMPNNSVPPPSSTPTPSLSPTPRQFVGDIRGALDLIRTAIRRRRALHLHYQTADGVESERWVRPLELERHGEDWLLHTYCMQRHDERCFRVDRIILLEPQKTCGRAEVSREPGAGSREPGAGSREPGAGSRRTGTRPPPAPRTGFFAGPPTPPPGSPLVRVWLE